MDIVSDYGRLLFGRRVVIVETDAACLALLHEAMAMGGLDSRFVTSLEALEGLLGYRPPDLLLISMRTAGSNWVDLLRSLHRRLPRTAIILLSEPSPESGLVVTALRNGAANVFHAGHAPQHLLEEMSWEVLHGTLADQLRPVDATPEQQLALLTRREREVLERLLRGKSNKQVAAELAISHRTVEAHRARCMRKLGARNGVDLARRFALDEVIQLRG